MKRWLHRFLKRFISRKVTMKLCYRDRESANRVFNALTGFFIEHRDDFEVVKAKIYDCSPSTSTSFEWCVYFKFAELNWMHDDNLHHFKFTMEDLDKIQRGALS